MNNNKAAFILLIILLLGLGLRLYSLGNSSLWHDEILTAVRSAKPITAILANRAGLHPPLHYLILHFFYLFGNSEFIVRLPAVIFGVLGIFMTYKVGKTFFSAKTGLLSAYLLAISPSHIYYSQEGRMYTHLIFFSLLTLYFCYLAVVENKKHCWWGFGIATILNLYTHYFAFVILVVELIFIIGILLKRKRAMSSTATLLFSIVLIIILWSLQIPYLIRLKFIFGGEKTLLSQALWNSLDPLRLFGLQAANSKIIKCLYLGTFSLGIISSVRRFFKELSISILWIAVPLAIFYFLKIRHFFETRYVLFLLPICFILMAQGIIVFIEFLNRIIPIGKRGYLTLAVILFASLNWVPIKEIYKSYKDNWQGAGTYLSNAVKDGDAIVIDSPLNVICLKYYFKHRNKNIIITTDTISLLKDNLPEKDIWYLAYDESPIKSGQSYYVSILEKINFKSSYVHLYKILLSQASFVKQAEDGYINNKGWSFNKDNIWETMCSNYRYNPEAAIFYNISIPQDGIYTLYACLRRDGERASLIYQIDNSPWSKPFNPDIGGTVFKYRYENVLLGTEILNKGLHTITFKNTKPYKGWGYQNIDYFYFKKKDET